VRLVQDGVQFPEMNREYPVVVTTLRPNVNSSCDVAAKYPRLGGDPTATESERVQVEEDNHAATIVVRVTALACDVVGSVLSFDRSPSAPGGRRSVAPEVDRDCTAAVTTLRPIVHASCDVAARHPNLRGHPTATESEPVQVEDYNHVATVVVWGTALACDVVGSVLSFDRSQRATCPTQGRSRR
jgi:hypothetical protein